MKTNKQTKKKLPNNQLNSHNLLHFIRVCATSCTCIQIFFFLNNEQITRSCKNVDNLLFIHFPSTHRDDLSADSHRFMASVTHIVTICTQSTYFTWNKSFQHSTLFTQSGLPMVHSLHIFYVLVCVCVALSSLARIWGESSTTHSLPVLFFFLKRKLAPAC